MNNNDLAALAALGAMGYMYKRHLDGQGIEASPTGERYPPVSDFVNRGALGTADAKRDIRGGGFDNTPAGVGVGTAGVDKRSDMDDFSGFRLPIRPGQNRSGVGVSGGKGGGSGSAAAARVLGERFSGSPFANSDVAAGVLGGTSVGSPFANSDSAPEDRGIGGAGLAAAGAGAAGAGAAAYYAKVRREARLADERAKLKAEARRAVLADQTKERIAEDRAGNKPRAITGDLSETQKMFVDGPDKKPRAQSERLSETKEMFVKGPDRAAAAQAQADAEAKSRMTQAEIDDELKRLKSKIKGADARAGVSKAAFAAGPTVTSASTTAPTENAARMTAAKKAAAKQAAAMEEFNKMLRESKVGPAAEEGKKVKARGVAGKVGLGLTALGLGTAANAATDMTAGQRERLSKDVLEGLVTPLGLTPGMAGEGSELYPSKPLSSAERKKMIEAMSPADRKKMQEALARQNPGMFDGFKRPSAANKNAAGGQIKTKRMASGGMTSTMSFASKRGDGIASKGKTRCKMY